MNDFTGPATEWLLAQTEACKKLKAQRMAGPDLDVSYDGLYMTNIRAMDDEYAKARTANEVREIRWEEAMTLAALLRKNGEEK